MGQYSIKELEQLSGIKAHTIRIWEKRHKIIEPSRTATNIRYYSDLDLKKIINVSLLNTYGIKISKIADMSLDDMNKKVLEISELQNDNGVHIDQMVIAMIDMDEELFEKILNNLNEPLRLFQVRVMAALWQDFQARSRNGLAIQLPTFHRNKAIFLPPNDQRRNLQTR